MGRCMFCDIIARREKAYILYENDDVCCFLDKYPINKGHVLVVPKKHYEEFSEVDSRSLAEVILLGQRIARILEKVLKPDGITVLQNNGIFKDVPHYHMHIFPRYKEDGFSWNEPDLEVSGEYFELFQQKIMEHLSMD